MIMQIMHLLKLCLIPKFLVCSTHHRAWFYQHILAESELSARNEYEHIYQYTIRKYISITDILIEVFILNIFRTLNDLGILMWEFGINK